MVHHVEKAPYTSSLDLLHTIWHPGGGGGDSQINMTGMIVEIVE